MGLFLDAIRRRADAAIDAAFPWSVPALRALQRMRFTAPVTFFMGENGCGKSTLLEALALLVDAETAGAEDVRDDETLAGARRLAAAFDADERGRPTERLFFRAEDAFGFTKRVVRDMRAIDAEADAMLARNPDDFRTRMGASITRSSRDMLAQRYGNDPHAGSHGETFLKILDARIRPGGLYLLDEPETPLSPTRVLTLLAMLHDATARGAQFIVATHSPILVALPGAAIRVFEGARVVERAFDELEHVQVTRDFLNAPGRYLRHLIARDEHDARNDP